MAGSGEGGAEGGNGEGGEGLYPPPATAHQIRLKTSCSGSTTTTVPAGSKAGDGV